MKNAQENNPLDLISTTPALNTWKSVPSTPSQMEIWLQCYLGGKEAGKAYSESYSNRLTGKLDIECMFEAIKVIVNNHEAMRATFSDDGTQIRIADTIKLPYKYYDISLFDESEKQNYISKHTHGTGFYEFDLEAGPLYLIELLKIDEEDFLLTFSGHHIMFDGWSITLFFSHLGLVYGQLSKGDSVFLPEVHKLSDYVSKLKNYSSGPEYQINLDYWVKKLSNPIPQINLPVDFDRPAIKELRSSTLTYKASPGLMLQAKRFAVQNKVSMHLLLLSVYEIFLSHWTKNPDVVVGMPRAGQPVMGCSNLMGHSVFLLPDRVKVDPKLTIKEYLQERTREFSQLLEHGIVTFGELVQHLKLKRDSSRTPIFSTTFNNSIGQERKLKFGDLERQLIANPKSFGNFEILLHLFGTIDNPTYEWTYNQSLFRKETMEIVARKYDRLIKLIIEYPNFTISSVYRALDSFEKSEGLALDFSNDQVVKDEEKRSIPKVVELFEKASSIFADKVAVTTQDHGLTYSELNQKANQLAFLLKSKGVRPGDYVGIYLERSNATIISVMAILKSGAAYLPMDVEIPEDRIIFMLKDSGAKYYITDQPAFAYNSLIDRRLEISGLMEAITALPSENAPVPTGLDNPMYIIYTSGSTGNPKGVILTHKNLNYLINDPITDLNYSSADILLGVTSVSFDMATFEILLPYLFGATVFMLDKYQRKDPKLILEFIESKNVTKMFATPTHWQMMVNSGWKNSFQSLSAICAGEPLKKSLVDQLFPLTKEIFNMYGPTEATVFTVLNRLDPADTQVTIGKEVPGTTIYFVDDSGNQIDRTNVKGEIWIGGEAVGKGYLGLDDLTKERFIKNPFAASPEWIFKSGDLGFRLDNGEIQCDGRIDHQVKIRGHRIELGEIEQRILAFEQVANAVVDTDDSHGFLSLVAFVSVKEQYKKEIDAKEFVQTVRNGLSSQLPEYMVPLDFQFVDDFIQTTSGKIDRNKLPRKGMEYKTAESENSSNQESLDNYSEVEKRVYYQWISVLGSIKLGLDSDFFLSGGHSLLGVKLISQLEKEFNISLTLLILFQYPTIRSLSAYISSNSQNLTSDSLVLIKKGNPEKVLVFVHGVGLNPIEVNMIVSNMDEDQTIYGLQSPAVSGQSKPFNSIQKMASHYLMELEHAGIPEPYNLIGNSIGGVIVFEMCRQLVLAGKRPGFVGMIDTLANFYFQKPKNIAEGFTKTLKKMGFEFQFLFEDLPYYIKYRRKYLQEKLHYKKEGHLSGLAYRIAEIETINRDAWKNYNIEPLDIEITLFLAKRKTFYVEDSETLGWGKYTKSIERVIMPGDHASMLKPPHGIEFTRALQKKLNQYKTS